MADDVESTFVKHLSCDECGSSDGNALYSNGSTYCFVCQTSKRGEGDVPKRQTNSHSVGMVPVGSFNDLPVRRINVDTCRKFGYSVSKDVSGRTCQIANYKRDGKIIAQKLRYADKTFKFIQDKEACKDRGPGLYGEHVWPSGGRMLVITEGEIDALSVSQAQNNKWPVVSLPNGADITGKGAVRDVRKSIDFVNSFDKVILMFDMDEPGQASAKAVAKILRPGSAFIASLPLKDANELLVAGRQKEIIDAMWNAKPYRPDGIISGAELWDQISKPDTRPAIDWPWDGLQQKTSGMRRGELVTITAGSGVGKSQVCREIAHHVLKKDEAIGYIALEENVRRTALGLMGIEIDKPLHITTEGVPEEDLRKAFDGTLGTGRVFLYDHFGSMQADNLLDKIRYLSTGLGVHWVVLDHLSIVVSGIDDGDERKTIDVLMTKLRSLVEETGIGLILVSHLKRPEGKTGWEEGLQTSLNALRGSASIAQLSDTVIGLERNQQSEDTPDEVTVRVLKNRHTGDTGVACQLVYDRDTARLTEKTYVF